MLNNERWGFPAIVKSWHGVHDVTKVSNNHSEVSKLISTNCCWILTTGLNCTFSSKKCFLSAAWSDLKVLGVKCELLMKFGLKGCLEDYENLWTWIPPVWWDSLGTSCNALHMLRSHGAGQWRCHFCDRQGSAALTKALFLCKSSFYLFVNMFKEWT